MRKIQYSLLGPSDGHRQHKKIHSIYRSVLFVRTVQNDNLPFNLIWKFSEMVKESES